QRRHSAALGINAANKMAWALRRDHDHVNIFRRNDGFEMNAEAMRKAQYFALGQVWLDLLFKKIALSFVRSKNVDPIRALGRFRGSQNFHAVGLRLCRALAPRVKPDDHLISAIAQILRLGMPLAAISEHCNGLVLQRAWIGVALIKNSCCHFSSDGWGSIAAALF